MFLEMAGKQGKFSLGRCTWKKHLWVLNKDHSTNTYFPTGIFMCPTSMLKDQPLENTRLLNA